MRFLTAPVFVLIAALVATTDEPVRDTSERHLQLLRSEPAADTVLSQSPTSVRLFFSEAPQERGVSVTLTDAAGHAGKLGEPALDEKDRKLLIVTVPAPLSDGIWKTSWRVVSRDGHIVRGDFAFTVRTSNGR